jgi:hypothetical protein
MDPTPSQRSLGATSARKVVQVHHGVAKFQILVIQPVEILVPSKQFGHLQIAFNQAESSTQSPRL